MGFFLVMFIQAPNTTYEMIGKVVCQTGNLKTAGHDKNIRFGNKTAIIKCRIPRSYKIDSHSTLVKDNYLDNIRQLFNKKIGPKNFHLTRGRSFDDEIDIYIKKDMLFVFINDVLSNKLKEYNWIN